MLSKALARHRSISATLLLCSLLMVATAAASPQKKLQARAEFRKAEKLRAVLEARPESRRRPADYTALIRLYDRAVHLAPAIAEADDSVIAAARLWVEMARLYGQRESLQHAAEKYRFLVKEYPASKFAKEARLALNGMESEQPAAGRSAPATVSAPIPGGAAANAPANGSPGRLTLVTDIRHWATPSYTRVVIELDGPAEYQAGRIANPERIFFDLHSTRLSPALKNQTIAGDDGLLKRIRMAQNQVGIARIVLEVGRVRDYSAFLLPNPYRLVVDINGGAPRPEPGVAVAGKVQPPETSPPRARRPSGPKSAKASEAAAEKQEIESALASSGAPTSKPVYDRVPSPAAPPAASPASPAPEKARETQASKTPARETPVESAAVPSQAPAPPVHAARPTSDGRRSLIRALGLKIGKIVIDPGHGGHDTGTIGPTGLMEKDLVLDIAKRLGALIEDRLGGEVIYTRDDDTFLPLESRTAMANQKQADLFVSIHANSSRDSGARGIETYYLNFTTSQDALEVAARENAVSEKSVHELQDLVKKITLKEKLEESREFAAEIQKSLHTTMSRGNTGLRNRGVKKAPFVVLIGANMPSILAEISFVSNPTDERLLRKAEYRQKAAEALYRGIQRYANSLAGVKVAHSRLGE